MAKRYTQVPIEYMAPIFEEWWSDFAKGELANIFFLPKGDILFRAMQFADWVKKTKNDEVILLNLEEALVNTPDIREVLSAVEGKNVVMIARRVFMQPGNDLMVNALEEWYARLGKGILILHEGFPAELRQYAPYPVFQQRQLVHRLYPEQVAKEYIENTAKTFGIDITEEQKTIIATYCGGVPWLVNDVIRRVGSGVKLFEDSVFQWKVQQIAEAIPKFPGISEDLEQFGLRDKQGGWVPWIADYWIQCRKKELEIEEQYIGYRGREYTNQFSRGERRVLVSLWSAKRVIAREELGKIFWEEEAEAEYSDWALDAMMCRLRKKLQKLSLPVQIVTRRGVGYECLG